MIKNVSNEELEEVASQVLDYLVAEEIISREMSDNVLGSERGYCPGKSWQKAVRYPEESHFLELLTNGLDVIKRRNIFYADGREFEAINCPNCGANNLNCDWGELFGQWLEDPTSAELECVSCEQSNSISKYVFEPTWALSNLGFIFWNWPTFKDSFLTELQELTGKNVLKVEGKL
ncbi:MAG: hypothetical protein JJ975_09465 [Bacteroidia bacterium]|nr:hypothetical protein [Bacteroidia bacterium]